MFHMKYLSGAVVALGAVICACSTESGAEDSHGDGSADAGACAPLLAEPPWTYSAEDPKGPSHWGNIQYDDSAPAYPDCANESVQQSPIAIPTSPSITAPFQLGNELAWSRAANVQSLRNDGHTWVAAFDPSQNTLSVGGTPYTLAQFHLHARSEHTIGGNEYPLEAHFVHLNPSGAQPFAVVLAVMFEESDEDNEELAKIWPKFSACPQATPTPVAGITLDLPKLLPEHRTYVSYDGSLTTPPCTAAARFYVFLDPIKASKSQVHKMMDAVGQNNRPIQPVVGGTQIAIHRP